jgi:hypothetical protein
VEARQLVFVSNISDIFPEEVPLAHIRCVRRHAELAAAAPVQVLTK